MLRSYYQLTKPGIIYGNVMTTLAGFLLASRWHIDFGLLLTTVFGTALVIAAACVVNNYIDRGLDQKMQRTRKRALATGAVSVQAALTYASVLAVLGFGLLIAYTNRLVVVIGLVAFVDYVVLYGLVKRRSVHGTLVGTIAGAAPVVAGYCAASDRFDGGALILFLILACWQMPHFYAIAIYRLKDYRAAGLPVWPAKRGLPSTKRQIVGYVVAFIAANLALSLFSYAGYIYAVVMTLVGLYWLQLGLTGFKVANDRRWARRMFLRSLIVILCLSVMLSFGSLLP